MAKVLSVRVQVLCIQYRLESSHWTRDDAAQLQLEVQDSTVPYQTTPTHLCVLAATLNG